MSSNAGSPSTGYVGDPPPEAPPTGEPSPHRRGAKRGFQAAAARRPAAAERRRRGRARRSALAPRRILAGHGVAERDFEALQSARLRPASLSNGPPAGFRPVAGEAAVVGEPGGLQHRDGHRGCRRAGRARSLRAGRRARAALAGGGLGRARARRNSPGSKSHPGGALRARSRGLGRTAAALAGLGRRSGPRLRASESAAAAATRRGGAWRELDDALAACGKRGAACRCGWLDDDCVAPTPALDHNASPGPACRLPGRAGGSSPNRCGRSLPRGCGTAPFASVLQHGCGRIRNHCAPEGAEKAGARHAPGESGAG